MSYQTNSKTVFHVKLRGVPFGLYRWGRQHSGGVVLRAGPLGHVQLQHYRMKLVGKQAEGRRGEHGVKLSWWGVAGRRRKRSAGFSFFLHL